MVRLIQVRRRLSAMLAEGFSRLLAFVRQGFVQRGLAFVVYFIHFGSVGKEQFANFRGMLLRKAPSHGMQSRFSRFGADGARCLRSCFPI